MLQSEKWETRRVELVEDAGLSARFPRERLAHIEIWGRDGRCFELREARPRWEAADPPSDAELSAKFQGVATGVIPAARAWALEGMVWDTPALPDANALVELLARGAPAAA